MTVYLPDIGGVLPVYVVDEYEGFQAKAFPDLTDVELDAYLRSNVAAVRDVAERAGGVDAALANHLIMGPAILARAGLRFAAKIHGSALEYTVKPHAEALPPVRPRGLGRGIRGAGRLRAHGSQPLAGPRRSDPAGEDAPGPARRGHVAVRPHAPR